MPPFLSDPSPSLYLLLIVAAVVAALYAYRNQNRRGLVVGIVGVGLLLVVFLIDILFQSPREEAVAGVTAMCDAASNRDKPAFLARVSERFDHRGVKKDRLENHAIWTTLKDQQVRVAAWDFSRDDVKTPAEDQIEIGFMAKGEYATNQYPVYVRTLFAKDPDGQYRLVGVKFFDPLKRTNDPEITIPYFP